MESTIYSYVPKSPLKRRFDIRRTGLDWTLLVSEDGVVIDVWEHRRLAWCLRWAAFHNLTGELPFDDEGRI